MKETYGIRLEKAIAIAEVEREDLADAMNITVQAISQVIVGRTKALTAENSAKAAKFLNVDHYWLATGIGSPRPAKNPPPVAQDEIERIARSTGVAVVDQIIELVALYQQASERGKSSILDMARSVVAQGKLRWRRTVNE